MGITLTSAVAAVLVNQTNRMRGQSFANAGPTDASWADLFVATEGAARLVDLTRVQSFYFTVVLVIAYGALMQQLFAQGRFICSFPELTPGMLTLLGIKLVMPATSWRRRCRDERLAREAAGAARLQNMGATATTENASGAGIGTSVGLIPNGNRPFTSSGVVFRNVWNR